MAAAAPRTHAALDNLWGRSEKRLAYDWNRIDMTGVRRLRPWLITDKPRRFQYLIRYWKQLSVIHQGREWGTPVMWVRFRRIWSCNSRFWLLPLTILHSRDGTNDTYRMSETVTARADLDTTLLTRKTKGGEIDGLYRALDADGIEVPETSKMKLKQYIFIK